MTSGADRIVVLAADDSESSRVLLRAVFTRRLPDIDFHSVETGIDCIEAIRHYRPHVVLLDLHLSDMDGAAVVKAVKADPGIADTPIVIVSGDTAACDELLAIGAADFITKPFVMTDLLVRVIRACERST